MNKLVLKNPQDDKSMIADFNLAVLQMICETAKELSVDYANAVNQISSRVLVFGEDYSGIRESEVARGASG